MGLLRKTPKPSAPAASQRPQLELNGPVLEEVFSSLLASCESVGGIERYTDALKLKSKIFKDALDDGALTISVEKFLQLCSLMPTVRRRVGDYCTDETFESLRKPMEALFEDGTPDERVANFCKQFPNDKKHRWVRDLANEILHNTDPERMPLMTRWVWDRKANTGVLREIWHGNVDHETLKIPDGYETFLMLREELSQYLTLNGIYKDLIWYVDMLCAQIYSEYISAQGGSYLRADFSSAEDPAVHMRRLLGLDGVKVKYSQSHDSTDADDNPILLLSGERE